MFMRKQTAGESGKNTGDLGAIVDSPELRGYFRMNYRTIRVVNKKAGLYEGVVVFKNSHGAGERIGFSAAFNHDYTIKTSQFKPNLNSEGNPWDYQSFVDFGGKVVRYVVPHAGDVNSDFNQHMIGFVIEYFQDIFEKSLQYLLPKPSEAVSTQGSHDLAPYKG